MSNRSKGRAKGDAISAAMSIADDVAEGRLDAVDLERQALAECRKLFGYVAGPDDALWELHVEVARQVLALDGIPYNELVEWVGVHRHRPAGGADDAEIPSAGGDVPPGPGTDGSVDAGPVGDATLAASEHGPVMADAAGPEPEPVEAEPVLPASGGYDPLRGSALHGQPRLTPGGD